MALQVELSPSTPETSQKDVIQPAIPLEKFLCACRGSSQENFRGGVGRSWSQEESDGKL